MTPISKSKNKKTESRKSSRLLKKVLPVLVVAFGIVLLVSAGYAYYVSRGRPDLNDFFSFRDVDFAEGEQSLIVCVQDGISQTARDAVDSWMDSYKKNNLELNRFSGDLPDEDTGCAFTISSKNEGDFDLVWQKYFVVIGNRGATLDEITLEDLSTLLGVGSLAVDDKTYSAAVSPDSYAAIDRILGMGVGVDTTEDAVDAVALDETLLAIVPFESVSHEVKIIGVEDVNLLTSGDISDYRFKREPKDD